MRFENRVLPSAEQLRDFLRIEGPVCMVNLVKYKAKATYPDGRDPDISGLGAYRRYALEMKQLVEDRGGRFVFLGSVTGLLLGEVEELWDEVGIVEYPSASTLLEIAATPRYLEIEVHRLAGLAGQLNIVTSERSAQELMADA